MTDLRNDDASVYLSLRVAENEIEIQKNDEFFMLWINQHRENSNPRTILLSKWMEEKQKRQQNIVFYIAL